MKVQWFITKLKANIGVHCLSDLSGLKRTNCQHDESGHGLQSGGVTLNHLLVLLTGFIFGTLSLVVNAQPVADTAYFNDLKERMEIEKEPEMLDKNLAGDSLDHFTGSLSFSTVDVHLTGNFNIPVQVRRTLARSEEYIRNFGDWQLDIPRIEGRYVELSCLEKKALSKK